MGFDRVGQAAFAAALVVVVGSSAALADPDEASRAAARNFMTEGRARKERNDLKGALESFRSADAIMHVPTTGVEVARAQVDLGDLLEAHETLDALLARQPAANEPPA